MISNNCGQEFISFTIYDFSPTDIDDFIVDDDGQPITKKRGKKFSGYTDAWVL